MRHVTVGVHVHTQPARLKATLDSLRAHTTQPIELILLPDGPDAATRAYLETVREIPQIGTDAPLGAPACFNRLLTHSQADLLILLESGALAGPDWLTHLLAALDSDPAHGLAGPSTNRAWNEQALFPRARGSLPEIARVAAEAARRYEGQWRTLEPLYSLADFCYLIRREVVEAVGAADEAYGLGPCWEMDYNIRAARAGFKGVWAPAAYVYRSPFTQRRRQMERQQFRAAKRRYQDRFCGLRLWGERSDYEPHCRGDECEHFAPLALIQINLPLPEGKRPPQREQQAPPPPAAPVAEPSPSQLVPVPEEKPLVSCIMPTGNRAIFVRQAVRYWQEQTYPNKELVIVDDGDDSLPEMLPTEPNIRYHRVAPGLSIGAKRNKAVALARGQFIVHWDDDDWYAPTRLQAQLEPLMGDEADITAFGETVFFDLEKWRFWRCTPALHRRLFVKNVHGGTLAYRRRLWASGIRYPHRSVAEDAAFLLQATRGGARLLSLPNERQFIYLRHGANSWAFPLGQYLDAKGWRLLDEPPLPARDRAFYKTQSAGHSESQPMVSCLMPTYNRRRFVPHAIRYFQRQDYPNRELIVLDDGLDPIADLIPDDPGIRYHRFSTRRTIGQKLNAGCELAQGTFIAHWDDDDWAAPWRLSYQMQALQANSEAALCGLSRLLYYQPQQKLGWQYLYPPEQRPWICGNTFFYRRSLWARFRHPNMNQGHDTRYVWQLPPSLILPLQRSDFLIAIIHADNTSPKYTSSARWQRYDITALQRLMGQDWYNYSDSSTVARIE